MKEAKVKVKKEKKYSAAKNLLSIIVGIVLLGVVFVGLIYLNNYVTDDVTYSNVIVAKTDIPENQEITRENAEQYFKIDRRDITKIPADAVTSLDDFVGSYANFTISEKSVVVPSMFRTFSTEIFKHPIEVSIPLKDTGYALCGTLREGDVINITIVTSEATENGSGTISTHLLKNVVVRKAYDSSNVLITAEADLAAQKAGKPMATTAYITFMIDDTEELEMQTRLYSAQALRISRELK